LWECKFSLLRFALYAWERDNLSLHVIRIPERGKTQGLAKPNLVFSSGHPNGLCRVAHGARGGCGTLPFLESWFGGSRLVALSFQVPLEVLAPDLYVAPELDAGYLPALYAPVDPALAHPKLPADVRDREEIEAFSSPFSIMVGLGTLRPLFSPTEDLLELYKRALQLF
jgi:hypothetical protein